MLEGAVPELKHDKAREVERTVKRELLPDLPLLDPDLDEEERTKSA